MPSPAASAERNKAPAPINASASQIKIAKVMVQESRDIMVTWPS
jgi:hypothetical protein